VTRIPEHRPNHCERLSAPTAARPPVQSLLSKPAPTPTTTAVGNSSRQKRYRSSPITLKSEVPGGAVIDGQNASDRNVGIYIDGSYNIVDGFEIKTDPKAASPFGPTTIKSSIATSTTTEIPPTPPPKVSMRVFRRKHQRQHLPRQLHSSQRPLWQLTGSWAVPLRQERGRHHNVLLANTGNGLQIAGYTTVAILKFTTTPSPITVPTESSSGSPSAVSTSETTSSPERPLRIGSYDAHGSGVNVDHISPTVWLRSL